MYMNTLKENITNFTITLFPDFETTKTYYIDKELNSKDFTKRLLAQTFESPKEKIKKFDYTKYVNNYNIDTLKQDIFEKYIHNNLKTYLEILLQTYTRTLLQKILDSEENIKIDLNIFEKIIKEEIDNLVSFLENIPQKQSYLLSSSSLVFEFQESNQKFSDDIFIKTAQSDSFSLIEVKFNNFDYLEFVNYKNNIDTAFSLILGCNVKFEIFDDVFSLYFKNYGCNKEAIDYMRDYYLSRKYRSNLLGVKVKINKINIDKIEEIYSICKDVLNNLSKDDYIKLAIDFYKDSLKDDKYGASKLTYLIIALEALFNTDKNEISRTIRQRCTKLLQTFYANEQVIQLEKDLKTAYGIRSCYAHGAKHTNPKAEFELVERILEYTKTALLLFLQLSKTYSKSEINKLLDDSLLYEDMRFKLQQDLKYLKVYFVSAEEKTSVPILDLKN